MVRASYVVAALTCAGAFALAGCGGTAGQDGGAAPASPEPSSSDPRSSDPPPPSGGQNDPALTKAADAARTVAQGSYANCFSGLVLDNSQRTLTVYRTPGCGLDDAVRQRVPDVDVVFRDAALTEAEMLALRDQIMADVEFWASRDIVINGAGPEPDGSAVRVMTDRGDPAEAAELTSHYGKPIHAVKEKPVLLEPGPAIRPGPVTGPG